MAAPVTPTELTPLLGDQALQPLEEKLDLRDDNQLDQRCHHLAGIKLIGNDGDDEELLFSDRDRAFLPLDLHVHSPEGSVSDSGVEGSPTSEVTDSDGNPFEVDEENTDQVQIDLSDNPQILELKEELKALKAKKGTNTLKYSFRTLTAVILGLQIFKLVNVISDIRACDDPDSCKYTPDELSLFVCGTAISVISLAKSFLT